jgi:ABC-type antimicrobial peptide transport system permease subunit
VCVACQWFAVLQGLAIALVQGTKDNTWNKETVSAVATYFNSINFGL